MNLLCIDDDLEDLELFSEAVKTIGSNYICVATTRGDEGLSLVTTLQPSFVFLDINMPIMNGRTVLKKIRANKSLDSVKVCILSTSITERESELYRKMGANFCLRKPNTFKELTAALKTLLETVAL